MKRTSLLVVSMVIATVSDSAFAAESINPSWYTSYVIDNSNQSGCASDANDGRVSGCSGGGAHRGPLKTWSEAMVNRRGCGGNGTCPRWQTIAGVNSVTDTFLSSDTAETINFDTITGPGFTYTIQCTLGAAQTIASGVLSSFVATNRSGVVANTFGSGLNWAALAGATLALNELVFDSTHPSYFWPYYDVTTSGGTPGAGNTWAFSQPIQWTFGFGASEPTIASGDSVTVYAPPTILINKAWNRSGTSSGGGGLPNNVQVRNCTIGTSVNTSVNANNGVLFDTDAFVSNLQILPGSNGLTILNNVSAPTSAVDVTNNTGGFGGASNSIIGGIFGSPGANNQNTLTCCGCNMDGDSVIGQTSGVLPGALGSVVGSQYIENGQSILVYPGVVLNLVGSQFNGGHSVIWGGGSINTTPGSSITYLAGAGGAAATFLNKQSIGLYYAGVLSRACYLNTVSGTQTCNLPTTATQADITLGTVHGCLCVPGGACLCTQ